MENEHEINMDMFGAMLDDVTEEIVQLRLKDESKKFQFLAMAMNVVDNELVPLTSVVFSPDGEETDDEKEESRAEIREQAGEFGCRLLARAYLEYLDREKQDESIGFARWAWKNAMIMVIDVSMTEIGSDGSVNSSAWDFIADEYDEENFPETAWRTIARMRLDEEQLGLIEDHAEIIRETMGNIMVVMHEVGEETLTTAEVRRLVEAGVPDYVPSDWID